MDDTVSETAPMLVAIDGPAGSGKSSVSREAAARLGFGILDTGAAYRALAWAALEDGRSLEQVDGLFDLLNEWRFDITLQGPQRVTVLLPGSVEVREVTEAIRTPELSGVVSSVSKHSAVRERLNRMFRETVAASGLPGVIIEGRDITTVVAPDAPVRILLTAAPDVRAKRRAGELPGLTSDQVLADLRVRDAKDAQVVNFITPAAGVMHIDTSDMNFEQSVRAVIDAVTAARSAIKGDT
jgi:cytidylate kinase